MILNVCLGKSNYMLLRIQCMHPHATSLKSCICYPTLLFPVASFSKNSGRSIPALLLLPLNSTATINSLINCLTSGSRPLGPGPWIQNHGLRIPDPRSTILDPGSWSRPRILDPELWIQDGFRVLGGGSRVLDRVLDPGVWILDLGCWILGLGSGPWTLDTGSLMQDHGPWS